MTSSVLPGYQKCTWCTDTHAGKLLYTQVENYLCGLYCVSVAQAGFGQAWQFSTCTCHSESLNSQLITHYTSQISLEDSTDLTFHSSTAPESFSLHL